jgi:hypothetical protein
LALESASVGADDVGATVGSGVTVGLAVVGAIVGSGVSVGLAVVGAIVGSGQLDSACLFAFQLELDSMSALAAVVSFSAGTGDMVGAKVVGSVVGFGVKVGLAVNGITVGLLVVGAMDGAEMMAVGDAMAGWRNGWPWRNSWTCSCWNYWWCGGEGRRGRGGRNCWSWSRWCSRRLLKS